MVSADKTVCWDTALRRIGDTKVEFFDAGLRDLQYAGGTGFKIGTDRYEFSPAAWGTVCGYLAIPTDLLAQLGQGLGGLVVKCLHGGGRRAGIAPDELRLGYSSNGTIVSVSPTRLACLTNNEVVTAIQDAWPSHISSETLSVAALHLSETEFEFTCYTDQLTTEPRPGDILYGGITIRHSQTGASPTAVLSYVQRLVCSNGMTQRVCLQGRPSRTKRCKAENSPTRMLEAIRQQVKGSWDQLGERLEGMQKLLEHRLNVDELPEGLRRRWSIKRGLAAEIATALGSDELGRTFTEYDLVNALSRVATHNTGLAPRYRRHLSLAAGMFAQRHVHQCPMCGSWLADNEVPTSPAVDTCEAAH